MRGPKNVKKSHKARLGEPPGGVLEQYVEDGDRAQCGRNGLFARRLLVKHPGQVRFTSKLHLPVAGATGRWPSNRPGSAAADVVCRIAFRHEGGRGNATPDTLWVMSVSRPRPRGSNQ